MTEKHKNISVGESVSPRKLEIELPNNVPSKVKPIVIFPNVECERVSVRVIQYGKCYGVLKVEVDTDKPHVINLNTGVE